MGSSILASIGCTENSKRALRTIVAAKARTMAPPPTAARGARSAANIGSALGSVVDHAARLALTAFDATRFQHCDNGVDADEAFDACFEPRGEPRAAIACGVRQRLDHDLHGIEALRARQHDLIVRCQAGDGEDLLFDLGWEDVNAAHDHHVVGASRNPFHAAHRACGARQQAGEIARAIADYGHGLFAEGRENQLALPALGQYLAAYR